MAEGKTPVLGYWAIRGLAQPIRHLLKYAGEPFEDRRYVVHGDASGYDRTDWTNVKEKLGLEFPNLPYLITDKLKISESKAILRYYARKHNLLGKTAEDEAVINELIDVVTDFLRAFTGLCYNGREFDNLRPAYVEALTGRFEKLERHCKGKHWSCGQDLSAADFQLYEYLHSQIAFEPHCLDKFPELRRQHDQFEALPAIAAYRKEPDYLERPYNNKSAHWK